MTRSSQRRTRIVCTLGPVTSSPAAIADLIGAGLDVVRLNFSHGDREAHRRTIRVVRDVSRRLGREVAILQDLCGPKIRLGELPGGPVQLTNGQRVALATDGAAGEGTLPVTYPFLLEDIHSGESILLADGMVELRVLERQKDRLLCEVVTGGEVSSGKGVNLPGTSLRVASFTEKDRADLEVGLEEGVDLVALSFVRHEKDVEPVRELAAAASCPPLVIAKIEKPQAVERLEQILERVDGVMVARGDLGVEMPVESVPLIQKRIIAMARRAAKPVITATQMLRSMVSSPRPTRAEAADVANAVLDGTDAVMLSEETAVGSYPLEAVAILDRIAVAVEPSLDAPRFLEEPNADRLPLTAAAISRAACLLARDVEAAAIVACTMSGGTARLVSRFRPPCPIVAITNDVTVERQLQLSWGVRPALVPGFSNTDAMLERARRFVVEAGLAATGDRIVVTAGLPINQPGTTNLLRVIEIS